MPDIPDAGRLSAHVILDAVTAWDPSLGIDDANNDAITLALDRLNEIDGAIEVDVDEDEEELDIALDVTNLAGGTIVLVNYLVHQLAGASGKDVQNVIAQAREFLDG
jgi:hypothetical protein